MSDEYFRGERALQRRPADRVNSGRPDSRRGPRKSGTDPFRLALVIVLPVLAIVLLFAVIFRFCGGITDTSERTGLGKNAPTEPVELRVEALVCIDPGHGGRDTGAIGKENRLEKDDDLRLSLAVGRILESWGVEVCYTRETDADVSLDERSSFANRKKADLFVSIHRNSADSKSVSGIEAWVDKSMPKRDTALAKNILAELDTVGYGDNRGVRGGYQSDSSANYAVNAATKMPSALIELGFITTEKDNKLFDELFDYYAYAVAAGIAKTLNGQSGPN